MDVDRLIELCRAHGGAVHVAVASGRLEIRPRRVRATAERLGWGRPFEDVITLPGTSQDAATRAAAALAHLRGPDADDPAPVALCRWSAADRWGVGIGAPARVQVVVPVARAPRTRPGQLEVVRTRTFDAGAVAERDDLAVVGAAWLVRTLAPIAPVSKLTGLVIDLVQAGHLTLDALVVEHDRWSGYPGRPRVREVLARLDAAGRTDSMLELTARDRFRAAGIVFDRGQVAVPCGDGRPIHPDLAIASIRFGIDLESMLAHRTRRQLRTDVVRTNALATAEDDWRVLRGTWEDLGGGWGGFLTTTRRVIEAQSRRHLGIAWPRPCDIAA